MAESAAQLNSALGCQRLVWKGMKSIRTTVSGKQLSTLSSDIDSIAVAVWPEFMLHDPIAATYWRHLYSDRPECQYAIVEDNSFIAAGNSVPICWERPLADLPEEGWDWILPKAVDDQLSGRRPNVLAAIQVMVAPDHQRRGLSAEAVRTMAGIATDLGLTQLIVPTRPTKKCDYPEVSIDEYVAWKDRQGLPADPWLRVHARLGGRIVKVCHRSMRITGSLADWRVWTGMAFDRNGPCIVPGALSPVLIDLQADTAEYVEPNVWMVHELPNPKKVASEAGAWKERLTT